MSGLALKEASNGAGALRGADKRLHEKSVGFMFLWWGRLPKKRAGRVNEHTPSDSSLAAQAHQGSWGDSANGSR